MHTAITEPCLDARSPTTVAHGVYENITKEQVDHLISIVTELQSLRDEPELDSPALSKVLGEMTKYTLAAEQAYIYQSKGGVYGGMPWRHGSTEPFPQIS